MFKRKKKAEGDQQAPTTGLAPALTGYSMDASVLTDVGCHREVNEDSSLYYQPVDESQLTDKGALVIVADGMGGHAAGEVASRMAVEVVKQVYYEDSGLPQEALKKAFAQANRAIHQASEKEAGFNGMGTTCTALVLRNGTAISAHVGDSRLYLIRNKDIYLMTEDHSAVMEMVKQGLLTLEQARHHADKNVILRALGSHPQVEATIWDTPFPIRDGDRFLLCSDGLYDLVEDNEIRDAVVGSPPSEACQQLIDRAKQRGGYDNITVAIVAIGNPENGRVAAPKATRGFEIPV